MVRFPQNETLSLTQFFSVFGIVLIGFWIVYYSDFSLLLDQYLHCQFCIFFCLFAKFVYAEITIEKHL